MTVKITKREARNWDELWCLWFMCPNCKISNIMTDHKYCPNCGYEITFTKQAIKKSESR